MKSHQEIINQRKNKKIKNKKIKNKKIKNKKIKNKKIISKNDTKILNRYLNNNVLEIIFKFSSININFIKYKKKICLTNKKGINKLLKFVSTNLFVFDKFKYHCDRCKLIDDNINHYKFKDEYYQFCYECKKLISEYKQDSDDDIYTLIEFPEGNIKEIRYYIKNNKNIDKIEYFKEGNIFFTIYYDEKEKSNCIKMKIFRNSDIDKIQYYNKKSHLSKWIIYDEKSRNIKEMRYYNNHWNNIKYRKYFKKNFDIEYIEYYNKNWNHIKYIKFFKENSNIKIIEYYKNNLKNLKKVIKYNDGTYIEFYKDNPNFINKIKYFKKKIYKIIYYQDNILINKKKEEFYKSKYIIYRTIYYNELSELEKIIHISNVVITFYKNDDEFTKFNKMKQFLNILIPIPLSVIQQIGRNMGYSIKNPIGVDICDPTCGTGGFLVGFVYRYLNKMNKNINRITKQKKQKQKKFIKRQNKIKWKMIKTKNKYKKKLTKFF